MKHRRVKKRTLVIFSCQYVTEYIRIIPRAGMPRYPLFSNILPKNVRERCAKAFPPREVAVVGMIKFNGSREKNTAELKGFVGIPFLIAIYRNGDTIMIQNTYAPARCMEK